MVPTYLPMTVIDGQRTTDNIQIYVNEKQYTCETLSEMKNNANAISRQEKIYYAYDRYNHKHERQDENSKANSKVK